MDIKLRLAFDSKARRILRESLIWTLFLITVAIVCRGHTTVEDTFSTNTAISLMLEKGVYADMGLADVSMCVTDTVTGGRGLCRHGLGGREYVCNRHRDWRKGSMPTWAWRT